MWPIMAVVAIASAPQNITRAIPRHILAPPTYAPNAPRTPNNISDTPITAGTMSCAGRKKPRGEVGLPRGERDGRRYRRLHRARRGRVVEMQFIPGMRSQRVFRHKLIGYLMREVWS